MEHKYLRRGNQEGTVQKIILRTDFYDHIIGTCLFRETLVVSRLIVTISRLNQEFVDRTRARAEPPSKKRRHGGRF